MRDLSTPSGVPIPWTFKAEIPLDRPEYSGIKVIATVSQVTVMAKLFFDARRMASQLLGVEPDSLELM